MLALETDTAVARAVALLAAAPLEHDGDEQDIDVIARRVAGRVTAAH
jgi:hypothetical protein